MRYFLHIILAAYTGVLCGAAECDLLELWSGREIILPGNGKWVLTAEHGRILGSGEGEAIFEIPPLSDGTTFHAVLTRGNLRRKIRFHSQRPLTGIGAGYSDLSDGKKKLLSLHGVSTLFRTTPDIWFCGNFPPNRTGKLFLVFPEKYAFPLKLGNDWKELALKTTEHPGSLGLLLNGNEQQLALDGRGTYAILRNVKQTIVVFSPDFDLDDVVNILEIKQLLKDSDT